MVSFPEPVSCSSEVVFCILRLNNTFTVVFSISGGQGRAKELIQWLHNTIPPTQCLPSSAMSARRLTYKHLHQVVVVSDYRRRQLRIRKTFSAQITSLVEVKCKCTTWLMTSFSCFENKINAGLDQDLVAWEGSEKKPLRDRLENGRHFKKTGDHNQSDQPTTWRTRRASPAEPAGGFKLSRRSSRKAVSARPLLVFQREPGYAT